MALSITGNSAEIYNDKVFGGKQLKRALYKYGPALKGHTPWKTRMFSYSRNMSLMMINNKDAVLLRLIDTTSKRILMSKDLTMAEFIPIEAYAKNFEESGEKEGKEVINLVRYLVKDSNIKTAEVCQESRRLLIEVDGRYNSFLVSHKLDKIFGEITEGSIIEKRKVGPCSDEYFMKSLQAEKIFSLSRDRDEAELKPKTPVLLDPNTLDEVKLFDVEQRPEIEPIIESIGSQYHALPTRIGDKLLLLTSQSYFSIFDYNQKKIISQFRHGPQMEFRRDVKITNINDKIFWTCSDCLYVATRTSTKKNQVKKVQKINLLDHIPQSDSLELKKDYSLFKLKSGNLLYVGARSNGATQERISVEFCPKKLKIFNTSVMGGGEADDVTRTINPKEFLQLKGDLFVSVVGKKTSNEGREDTSFGLGLWNKDLTLLDESYDYELRDLQSIKTVEKNLVTARGSSKNYLLYQIDEKSRRIIVNKNLLIVCQAIRDVKKTEEKSKELKCLVDGIQGEKDLLLRFNTKLELLSWTDKHETKWVDR